MNPRSGKWVACLTVLVLAACGGGKAAAKATTPVTGAGPSTATSTTLTKETAGDAALSQIDLVTSSQGRKMWDELHPAQQAVIPREQYAQCLVKRGPGNLGKLSVDQSYSEDITIPGTSVEAHTTAVVIKATDGSKTTVHEILVDGAWRGVIENVSGYANGGCP